MSRGRLDLLARITRRATGNVRVRFISGGRTSTFTVPIANGTIRRKLTLPRAQRRRRTGIVEISYAGNDRVRADDVRLRAASGRAQLRRARARIRNGRLEVAGTISSRAVGVVRIRMEYVKPDGTVGTFNANARISRGRWSISETLPAEARAGGQLSIQFTGYEPRRIRGEQDAKQVP